MRGLRAVHQHRQHDADTDSDTREEPALPATAVGKETKRRGDTVPLFPSLNLHYARNYGAAFSFLADSGGWQRWFFAGIAIGICVVRTTQIPTAIPAKNQRCQPPLSARKLNAAP